MPPLVSVVIPAYNAARTLESTVRSAHGQTVEDLEVIIVDDGSSDNTAEVAARLADSRTRFVAQKNGGAAAARNTGIAEATGKYVAFLDADDLWLPNKLERQLDLLARNPDIKAAQCGAAFVDDEMRILSVVRCIDSKTPLADTLVFQNLPAFLSALIVEREQLVKFGGFAVDLEILEEWDMAIKASRHCDMRSIPEPLVLYRVHPGNRHRNVDIHLRPGMTVLKRLFSDESLPPEVRRLRRRAYGALCRTFAGGYVNAGQFRTAIPWMLRSLTWNPAEIGYFATMPIRRIQRRRSSEAPLDPGLLDAIAALKERDAAPSVGTPSGS